MRACLRRRYCWHLFAQVRGWQWWAAERGRRRRVAAGGGGAAGAEIGQVERQRFAAMVAVDAAALDEVLSERLRYCHSTALRKPRASSRRRCSRADALCLDRRAGTRSRSSQQWRCWCRVGWALAVEQGQPLQLKMAFTDVYEVDADGLAAAGRPAVHALALIGCRRGECRRIPQRPARSGASVSERSSQDMRQRRKSVAARVGGADRRRRADRGAVDDQHRHRRRGWHRSRCAPSPAGSELVRITVNNDEAAAAVPVIRQAPGAARRCEVPLIGDFHFNGHKLLTEPPGCARRWPSTASTPATSAAAASATRSSPR